MFRIRSNLGEPNVGSIGNSCSAMSPSCVRNCVCTLYCHHHQARGNEKVRRPISASIHHDQDRASFSPGNSSRRGKLPSSRGGYSRRLTCCQAFRKHSWSWRNDWGRNKIFEVYQGLICWASPCYLRLRRPVKKQSWSEELDGPPACPYIDLLTKKIASSSIFSLPSQMLRTLGKRIWNR